jgi:hypothetical protein
MKIAKPQVHLRFDNNTEKYNLHVVTWMDFTKFKEDGHEPISTSAVDGVFTVNLKIKEESSRPNMQLLTPIVHTLELNGIVFSSSAPFLEVNVIHSDDGSLLGRRKTHQDDSDDSGMPL